MKIMKIMMKSGEENIEEMAKISEIINIMKIISNINEIMKKNNNINVSNNVKIYEYILIIILMMDEIENQMKWRK